MILVAYTVKFIKQSEFKKEKTILDIAQDLGVKIKSSCDGKGKCGKCIVKVISGNVSEPTKFEMKELGENKLSKGYRLACEVTALGDVDIELE